MTKQTGGSFAGETLNIAHQRCLLAQRNPVLCRDGVFEVADIGAAGV